MTLVRLYDNTCKGKPTVKNDFFAVTPRQAAISQAYMPNYYLCSAENDKTFAIAYNMGSGHMGPIDIKVFVVDANGVCKGYRNAIKDSYNKCGDLFFGSPHYFLKILIVCEMA